MKSSIWRKLGRLVGAGSPPGVGSGSSAGVEAHPDAGANPATVVDDVVVLPVPHAVDRQDEASGLVLTDEFLHALDLLDAGEHVFVTGKAGTGKSTLIRHYLATTSRNCVVAAPTGIAALNVDGYTVHRLFGFRPSTTIDDVSGKDYKPGRNAGMLKSIDTLVIDEASMVRADLFDCIAVALERFGPKPGSPFGGVQIVLVGDLYQLPPVVTDGETEYFSSTYATPYFFSATRYRRDEFPTVRLTKIFRQAGDRQLTGILNAIQEGTIDDDAREVLNGRKDAGFEPPLDEYWLTLTTTNRMAESRNRSQLDRVDQPQHQHVAMRRGELDKFEPPTPETLHFKVGAQVMLLNNDSADRWVNGTLGRIVGVSLEDPEDPAVMVSIRDGRTVRMVPHTWDITRPSVQGGRLVHESIGSYTQFPFKLAWAITIHKSQGQTLERVVVDLTGGTFAYGQLYVALSRCTSMAGLVLERDVLPKDLKVDHRIKRFLAFGEARAVPAPHVYLGLTFIGDEGRAWRPRPIEIAAVTDDGESISTFVDPERDLGTAGHDYGFTAGLAQLSPRLPQAWTALAPLLAGRTPVGVDLDRSLGYLDFEFKRLGQVVPMPNGIDLDTSVLTSVEAGRLHAPTALERALTARSIADRVKASDPYANEFLECSGAGYLLQREEGKLKFELGKVATNHSPDHGGLATLVREKIEGKVLSAESLEALRDLEQDVGASIIPEQSQMSVSAIEVLEPGARVCFTGTVSYQGKTYSKEDLTSLAEQHGLVAVNNVTKTKCDVLVCAELGTQSGKAQLAAKYGKPTISAADFLAWATYRES